MFICQSFRVLCPKSRVSIVGVHVIEECFYTALTEYQNCPNTCLQKHVIFIKLLRLYKSRGYFYWGKKKSKGVEGVTKWQRALVQYAHARPHSAPQIHKIH